MTLDDIAKEYRWDGIHDYGSSDSVNGKLTSIYGLGIWQPDLEAVRSRIPNLRIIEKGRVTHVEGIWLRVDLHDLPTQK